MILEEEKYDDKFNQSKSPEKYKRNENKDKGIISQ